MSRAYIKLIFLGLLFYIFFSGIGSYGLLSKDEPRYAGCALEMIENHDWIYPKFNFQDRFDKPALFYWLIALSYKLLGVSDFSSRVPSALAAILLVLFTWYAGSKILGHRVGFLSAMILPTSVEYIALGRRAATDMVICCFLSATLYSFYLYYNETKKRKKFLWAILAGIFEGLAILTKGPVGIILPSLVIGLFLILIKELNLKHLKTLSLISFVAILLSFPWYIAVHFATNGGFTRDFFLLHNIQRFTSIVGKHPGPIWFYIPVLFVGFLPWIIFLLPTLVSLIKQLLNKKRLNKFILFCFIWLIAVFIFFSTSKTKLLTYILPVFPSMALITGYWINIIGLKYFKLLKTSIMVLLIGLFTILIIGASVIVPKLNLQELDKNILITRLYLSSGVLITASVVLFITIKRHVSLIVSFILIFSISGIPVLNAAIKASYIKSFSELKEYAILARTLGAKEIISYVGYKPILVYYGRVPVDFNSRKKQISKIQERLNANKDTFIIVSEPNIQKMKHRLFSDCTNTICNKFNIVASGRKYALVKIK